MAEAKRQLAEEADYLREGAQMARFGELLAGDPAFVVPRLDPDLSTRDILAMDFIDSVPIETLTHAPQPLRDSVMTTLIALVLRELLEFGMMQTDPNFANYRYQPDTGRLVLLDFGAARPVPAATASAYRDLLQAGLDQDRAAVTTTAVAAGFVGAGAFNRNGDRIAAIIDIFLSELHRPGPFDFGDRGFVGALRDHGMAIAADKAAWHIPPAELLFIQRKISGTALLAARLEARVNIRGLARAALVPRPA